MTSEEILKLRKALAKYYFATSGGEMRFNFNGKIVSIPMDAVPGLYRFIHYEDDAPPKQPS